MQKILIPYKSTISGKAGLITETQLILEQVAQGKSISNVRNQVLKDNLLSKRTSNTREGVWKNVKQRYFTGRDESTIEILARFTTSALSLQARNLVLFYTFAQADKLLYDFVIDILYQAYHSGQVGIEKAHVFNWLNTQSIDGHPEIAVWSPQTRNKLVSHLLSITRDFGLLSGIQHKAFHHLYVPLPAFLYVLYDQYTKGLGSRQLVEAEAFQLFLLDQENVLLLLGEASSKGYVTFRHAGNMYDLKLHFRNLKEAIDYVINTQVP